MKKRGHADFRLGWTLLVLAAGAFALGTLSSILSGLVMSWLGLVFAGVGVAYVLNRPSVFAKSSSGRVHPVAMLVLAPSVASTRIS
jgi:hypothetical protein